MAFLFGEELLTVGDYQAEVAGAGLIQPREIDLIENPVTQREPNPAAEIERGAYARFGARGPARWDSGPARRITNIVAHRDFSSAPGSWPEDTDSRSLPLEEREKCV
jgi:hypothetical protein